MDKKVTGGGDGGFTSLGSPIKISKADERLDVLGAIEELRAELSACGVVSGCEKFGSKLERIFGNLSLIESGLYNPAKPQFFIPTEETAYLDGQIGKIADSLASLCAGKPNALSVGIDKACAVARKLERKVAFAAKKYSFDPSTRAYINRLSDYLRVLSKLAESGAIDRKTAVLPSGHKADEPGGAALDLATAKTLSEGVRTYAASVGKSVVVAVVNSEGRPITVDVMDGAFLVSFDVALKKAYTSVAVKMSTADLGKAVQPGGALFGFNEGGLVYFGGGEPLIRGGAMVGGLGVSGGTAEEDGAIAAFGAKFFEEMVK